MYRFLLLIPLLTLLATPVRAQASRSQEHSLGEIINTVGAALVTRSSGGSVKIDRGGFGGSVSARSSIELDWIMVTDSTLGLVFDEPVGAKGNLDSGWYSYRTELKMRALKPVTAFDVRVLTFNIWKEFTGTISFTQLEDLLTGQSKSFDRIFGAYGESVLRELQTSVSYRAKVKYADGTVVEADSQPVLEAA